MTHSRHLKLKPVRCKKENPYIDVVHKRTYAVSFVKDRKERERKKREKKEGGERQTPAFY